MPRFCVAKICGMVPHLKLKNLTTGCPKKSVKEKLGEEFVFELKNLKKNLSKLSPSKLGK